MRTFKDFLGESTSLVESGQVDIEVKDGKVSDVQIYYEDNTKNQPKITVLIHSRSDLKFKISSGEFSNAMEAQRWAQKVTIAEEVFTRLNKIKKGMSAEEAQRIVDNEKFVLKNMGVTAFIRV